MCTHQLQVYIIAYKLIYLGLMLICVGSRRSECGSSVWCPLEVEYNITRTWVIPCQINTKNGHPSQITMKLGMYVVWVKISDHNNFWCQQLHGFGVILISCQNYTFLVCFSVPSVTILIISLK